jgi:hypothetical protein
MVNDNNEEIFITEDLELEAREFCKRGYVVESDTKINCKLPSTFPLETVFTKMF